MKINIYIAIITKNDIIFNIDYNILIRNDKKCLLIFMLCYQE